MSIATEEINASLPIIHKDTFNTSIVLVDKLTPV